MSDNKKRIAVVCGKGTGGQLEAAIRKKLQSLGVVPIESSVSVRRADASGTGEDLLNAAKQKLTELSGEAITSAQEITSARIADDDVDTRERYIHDLIGDVESAMIASEFYPGMDRVDWHTTDDAIIILAKFIGGFEEITVPFADLQMDFSKMEEDVKTIMDGIFQSPDVGGPYEEQEEITSSTALSSRELAVGDTVTLSEDYFYDVVTNIQEAGWDEVVVFAEASGWVSEGQIIIPAGTAMTLSNRDRYFDSYSVTTDAGTEIVPFNRDFLIENPLVLTRDAGLQDISSSTALKTYNVTFYMDSLLDDVMSGPTTTKQIQASSPEEAAKVLEGQCTDKYYIPVVTKVEEVAAQDSVTSSTSTDAETVIEPGDLVVVKVSNRPGRVLQLIGNDVVEVEFAGLGEYPARIDRFYTNEVELVDSTSQQSITSSFGIYDEEEVTDWEYVKSKTVKEAGEFVTDYTMYYSPSAEMYAFVLGERSFTNPSNTAINYVCQTEGEAEEWFAGYNGPEDDDPVYLRDEDDDDLASDWQYVKSKSVQDSDGFMTDYTMYYSPSEDMYAFVFGDNDIYNPENTAMDHTCETEGEAEEWFASYNGFADDDFDFVDYGDDDQGFTDEEMANITGGDRRYCPECGSNNYYDGVCYSCGYGSEDEDVMSSEDVDSEIYSCDKSAVTAGAFDRGWYFGKEQSDQYGNLIAEKLSGKTVSKRKDTAEEPGGLIYEANKLGIDMWDLLGALEGMCYEGRAREIDDSTYRVA